MIVIVVAIKIGRRLDLFTAESTSLEQCLEKIIERLKIEDYATDTLKVEFINCNEEETCIALSDLAIDGMDRVEFTLPVNEETYYLKEPLALIINSKCVDFDFDFKVKVLRV